ncbi:MAG: 50S ribosomal protein L29 [Deltaproteobacteria bacterium]|nr:50S ribosomal protein L29 [Deltaproteobacteria bacterium]
MKAAELQGLGDAELVHMALDLEHKLVEARFAHSLNKLENTAKLAVFRKDIARIRTELRTRELAQSLGQDAIFRAHRGSWTRAAAQGISGAGKGQFLAGLVDKIDAAE